MDCRRIFRGAESESHDDELVSHGLCIRCYAKRVDAIETTELQDWTAADLAELPTGQIILDERLRVVRYSETESLHSAIPVESTLGRDFFGEIAPCMVGEEISMWCRRHLHSHDLKWKSIDWLMKLEIGDQLATLDICAGQGRIRILIERYETDGTPAAKQR